MAVVGGGGGVEMEGAKGRRGYVIQVQCRFTSTVTIRNIRDRGALDVHLDFHTAPELGYVIIIIHCFYIALFSTLEKARSTARACLFVYF